MTESMKHQWSQVPGVEVIGSVQDVNPYYEKALGSVVPVYQGSGTCIKTLEGLHHGRVVLSTSFGARGIPFKDESDTSSGVCLFTDAASFIHGLEENVLNAKKRTELEQKAVEFISKNYTYESFEAVVRETIEKHLDDKKTPCLSLVIQRYILGCIVWSFFVLFCAGYLGKKLCRRH